MVSKNATLSGNIMIRFVSHWPTGHSTPVVCTAAVPRGRIVR